MSATPQTLFLADDDATADLGRRLAAVLRPGDLVRLEGDLGAGKTALARTVIRTLVGDAGLDVPSPSFALVQPYEANGHPVLHADLYRISSPREVDELGLFDRTDAIVLVEWPERSDEVVQQATVRVSLAVPSGGDGRMVTVEFEDGRVL
jgi:tRNA threonylcarbamoyladenosine biosynthesis protein TsaE